MQINSLKLNFKILKNKVFIFILINLVFFLCSVVFLSTLKATSDLKALSFSQKSVSQKQLTKPNLSPLFQEILEKFNPELVMGSFGGKKTHSTVLNSIPIIFIHGNSDSALGVTSKEKNSHYKGWSQVTKDLIKEGYKNSELYGLTWGNSQPDKSLFVTHNENYVMHVAQFIEAVLDHTGSNKVHVVAHSMGVSLSLLALKRNEKLIKHVDTFVGIAGATQGLNSCRYFNTFFFATCNIKDGFHPRSDIIKEINKGSKVAQHIINVQAKKGDKVILNNSTFIHEQDEFILTSFDASTKNIHMEIKNSSAKILLKKLNKN